MRCVEDNKRAVNVASGLPCAAQQNEATVTLLHTEDNTCRQDTTEYRTCNLEHVGLSLVAKDPHLTILGQPLRAIQLSEPFTTLGLTLTADNNTQPSKVMAIAKYTRLLEQINQSLLTAPRKLHVLRTVARPILEAAYFNVDFMTVELKALDSRERAYTREWLGDKYHSPTALYAAAATEGGLGLTPHTYRYTCLRLASYTRMLCSHDSVVRMAAMSLAHSLQLYVLSLSPSCQQRFATNSSASRARDNSDDDSKTTATTSSSSKPSYHFLHWTHPSLLQAIPHTVYHNSCMIRHIAHLAHYCHLAIHLLSFTHPPNEPRSSTTPSATIHSPSANIAGRIAFELDGVTTDCPHNFMRLLKRHFQDKCILRLREFDILHPILEVEYDPLWSTTQHTPSYATPIECVTGTGDSSIYI